MGIHAILMLAALLPAAAGPGDPGLAFVRSIGGPERFDTPYDVDEHGGRLYIADSHNNQVQVLDCTTGETLFQFGTTGTADGQFARNRGLAVGEDSQGRLRILVADAKNDRVQLFDGAGQHLASQGQLGLSDENWFRPRGTAMAPGLLVVCDGDNHRVKLLREDLSLVQVFGRRGSSNGEFVAPFDAALGPAGELYIADVFNHRVQRFDRAANWQLAFGGYGPAAGQLVQPRGLAVDPQGRVYVAEVGDETYPLSRVQVFDAQGEWLSALGERGGGPAQLRFPAGLDVAPDGTLYVADSGNHRISVWAPAAVPAAGRSFGGWKAAPRVDAPRPRD